MLTFLKQIIDPPVFPTTEETRLGQMLHFLLLLGILLSAGFFVLVFNFVDNPLGPQFGIITSLIFMTLFGLLHKGWLQLVTIGLLLSSYCIVLIALFFNGGIRDEAGLALIAVLSIISFFLGRRPTVWIGLLTMLVLIGLYVGEHLAWIEENEHFEPAGFDDLMIALIAVGASTAILTQLVGQLETQNKENRLQAEMLLKKNKALIKTQNLLEEKAEHLTEAMTELQEMQHFLIEAKDEAESANQIKSDFLLRMSHDLRSPLTSMIGLVDGLIKMPTLDESEQIEWLIFVRSNGNYLLGLIDNLLDLSRIEANKLEVVSDSFLLLACLQDIEKMMRILAEEQGLQFIAQFDGKLPSVFIGDEQRLRQVLINLLENGIKYTHEGSVSFNVNVITAISPHVSSTIRFDISDTGIGIPTESINQIFHPFEQLESKKSRSGVGLGLAICSQLLELMGAKLQAESKEGVGSRFWFELSQ